MITETLSQHARTLLTALRAHERCAYSYLKHCIGDTEARHDFRTVTALDELTNAGMAERFTITLRAGVTSTYWRAL